ncbi:MAG: EAL domain-containing protein [Clostridia bacterium]
MIKISKKIMLIMSVFAVLFSSTAVFATDITTNDMITLTQENLKLIQEQNTYKIGYYEYAMPITYTTNGKADGLAVEIMNELSSAIGVTFDFINLEENPNAQYDIIITPLNYSNLRRGESYLTTHPILITKELYLENDFQTLGMQNYFGIDDEYGIMDNKTVYYYDTIDEMLQDLKSGKIEGILISDLQYQKVSDLIQSNEYRMIILSEVLQYNIYFSDEFADDKIDILNKLMLDYTSLEIDNLISKYTNLTSSEVQSIDEMFNENIGDIFVAIAVLLIFFLAHKASEKVKLKKQLDVDDITGLLSESKFIREVGKRLEEQPDLEYAIMSFDVDNFKYINETFGYEIGTKVLKKISTENSKIWGQEVLFARSYGDNYLMMLSRDLACHLVDTNCASFDTVTKSVEAMLGGEYTITFSIGIYLIEDPTIDVTLMIDGATYARNQSKSFTGDSIEMYDQQMQDERNTNNRINSIMREAVTNNEFVMYYQPKFDLKTQKTIGAEALVRWIRNSNLIPPNEFIPLFEKNGFIERLDFYVLEEVCKFLKFRDVPVISVNFSGITICKPDFTDRVMEIMRKHKISPRKVDIEITESAFVGRGDEFIDKLIVLRSLGFTVSMDDFGVGISSLNRLKTIPIDVLKIDQEFISDSIVNEKGRVIVENVIKMSKQIGLKTVAEGIETKEQLDFLIEQGCDIGQGYYHSKPMTAERFLEDLRFGM